MKKCKALRVQKSGLLELIAPPSLSISESYNIHNSLRKKLFTVLINRISPENYELKEDSIFIDKIPCTLKTSPFASTMVNWRMFEDPLK